MSELKILINLIIEWQLGEHPTASICEWNKNFISPVQDKHVHFMIHKILPYPITKCWHEYSHVQVRCKVLSHKRRFCRHVRLKSIEYPLSNSMIKKKLQQIYNSLHWREKIHFESCSYHTPEMGATYYTEKMSYFNEQEIGRAHVWTPVTS